ncbi:MAG: putative metal-binding motif-containing protein, partial [Deltaproteobacteria bacterium]|nr:putative metal-binding motif-containing protein [Deltaproteobacteria bacterium]
MKCKNRSWQRFAIAGLLALPLLAGIVLPGCGGDNQTGLWVRIVSPDVTITHVRLYIYDATSYQTTPVMDVSVPDPPFPVAKKFDPTADLIEHQLWVLVLAGGEINQRIRIVGIGYRNDKEVANGSLENLDFVDGQIVDLGEQDIFLALEGCQDNDEDGFCPPNDCDDDDADIHPDAIELCDNLDNNCNGSTDEGECPCPPGEERACWPHWADAPVTLCMHENNPKCPCTKGVQTCEGGLWGLCVGLQTPVEEGRTVTVDQREIGVECDQGGYICYLNCIDTIDNDCDFFIDEKDIGCGGCRPGDRELCYDADEKYLNHMPCSQGERWCSDDASWGECQGQVLPLGFNPDDPDSSDISEQGECNGFDDDCDGITDNVVWLLPCDDKNRGCCANATKRCENGSWIFCSEADLIQFAYDECYTPELGDDYEYYTLDETTEHCDGLDNDCNGLPDDVFDGSGNRLCICTAGQTAVCQDTTEGECVAGDFICIDGQLVMDQFCVQPIDELCDDLDNDCDGITDLNEAARLDCLADIGPQENASIIRCIQGVCQCECDHDNGWWDNDADLCTLNGSCEYRCYQTEGAVERCDDYDNNCNGSIDAADPLASVDSLCPSRPGTKIAGRGGEPGGPADACIGAECQFECVAPYDDCNNDVRLPVPQPGEIDISNGCETDLTDTLEHCGVCDNLCF